jgi:periplasmic protein CpxP/Spy
MDIFTQKKLLVRIVLLLTVLNMVLIGLFLWKDFFHRPPPRVNANANANINNNETRDISRILEKELKLSRDQVNQIINIRSVFFEKEKVLEKNIQSERDSMNSIMFIAKTDEELVRSLAMRVADNEFKIEMLRFGQAKEFKSVCKPDQLEKFESLIREIRDYLQMDNKPRRNNKPKQDNKSPKDDKPKRK